MNSAACRSSDRVKVGMASPCRAPLALRTGIMALRDIGDDLDYIDHSPGYRQGTAL
jgi:hypothetical protein